MADEQTAEKTSEAKPESARKARGPVLLEAVFAGAQIVTTVTGAGVLAVSLFKGTPAVIAFGQALLATATLGAVVWTLHWMVTHGLLTARKAELESAAAEETAALGTNVEVQA